jgi:pyridoxine 5-phosphate synthase
MRGAAQTGTDRIELYTGPYAEHFHQNKSEAVRPYIEASNIAKECGILVNAGHDLNLDNLKYFAENVTHLDEVSIGHALISDALYFGIENVIQMYKRCLINHF